MYMYVLYVCMLMRIYIITPADYGLPCISPGSSVCIDNTNLDVTVRAKWLEVAATLSKTLSKKVKTKCIYLNTPKSVSFSLAVYRLIDPNTAVVLLLLFLKY